MELRPTCDPRVVLSRRRRLDSISGSRRCGCYWNFDFLYRGRRRHARRISGVASRPEQGHVSLCPPLDCVWKLRYRVALRLACPMMTTASLPFWKHKRWIAAGVLWLVVAYPISVGPIAYAVERGWILQSTAETYVKPIEAADDAAEAIGNAYQAYVNWCEDVGYRHAASE